MELNVISAGKNTAKLDVADAVFGIEFKESLIHQVVTATLARERSGSSKQKTRSEVRGGGAKPWRQKGTGRARAGTSRSPLWRKGGVTFAAKPRSYEQKLNKKMYRVAIRSILSELNRQERLMVVDEFSLSETKTKAMVAKLQEYNVSNVLIITEGMEPNLYLSSRNLIGVSVIDVAAIDPVSLVSFDHVIMTVPAVKLIEESLS